MDGGFVPRLLVEVAFLGLLALALGLAELSAAWIVAIMTVGWLLVVLVEWLAWRGETGQAQGAPALRVREEDGGVTDDWDMEEILAPLPEDAEEAARAEPGEPPGDEGT